MNSKTVVINSMRIYLCLHLFIFYSNYLYFFYFLISPLWIYQSEIDQLVFIKVFYQLRILYLIWFDFCFLEKLVMNVSIFNSIVLNFIFYHFKLKCLIDLVPAYYHLINLSYLVDGFNPYFNLHFNCSFAITLK